MPEGTPYASSNVVAGTGLDLNYVGKHCFAYSGSIIVNNSTETLLSFTTGSSYIIAEFKDGIDFTNVGTKFVGFTIKINDIVVLTNYHTVDSGGKNESNTPSTYRLVIPPYSQVVTEGTTNSAADIPFYHIITGKLYK